MAVAADRAVTDGSEIDLQHIVPYVPSTMRALDIVVTQPGPQDVVELRAAEADEEIQTFALDGAYERFRECIGVRRPVRDLDDLSGSFPTKEAATKMIFFTIRNFEKGGRAVGDWVAARNQLATIFTWRFD